VHFLTDFADQAVVLPLLAAMTVTLAVLGWWRGAIAWFLVAGGTLGVMLALKLVFLACGGLVPQVHLRTPSGHTAAAAVMAGGLMALLGTHYAARAGLALLAALGAAAIFGASRLALGMHTLPEVIVGGLVGMAGAWLLSKVAGPAPKRLKIGGVLAVVVAVLILFHGFHLPAEARIYHAAALLRVWPLSACRI
jgi:membrane-associated phospholipid phosphatase